MVRYGLIKRLEAVEQTYRGDPLLARFSEGELRELRRPLSVRLDTPEEREAAKMIVIRLAALTAMGQPPYPEWKREV